MLFSVKERLDFGKNFWSNNPLLRGKLIDTLRNQNIPHNSKAIDRTENTDCIISHKSTNLLNKSYSNPITIYYLGLRFIKQLESYKGEIRRNNKIGATYYLHWATDNPSCKRILEWYIPEFPVADNQIKVIEQVVEAAALRNIRVDVYTILDY